MRRFNVALTVARRFSRKGPAAWYRIKNQHKNQRMGRDSNPRLGLAQRRFSRPNPPDRRVVDVSPMGVFLGVFYAARASSACRRRVGGVFIVALTVARRFSVQEIRSADVADAVNRMAEAEIILKGVCNALNAKRSEVVRVAADLMARVVECGKPLGLGNLEEMARTLNCSFVELPERVAVLAEYSQSIARENARHLETIEKLEKENAELRLSRKVSDQPKTAVLEPKRIDAQVGDVQVVIANGVTEIFVDGRRLDRVTSITLTASINSRPAVRIERFC